MQETSIPPDLGFVVEWQMADDASLVVDLAAAESEARLPNDVDEHRVGGGGLRSVVA